MDDEGVLFIGKSLLKANKQEFILENLLKILEVAAHDGDTRKGLDHGYGFKDNFWRYAQDMGGLQKKLLNNEAP